MVFDEYFTVLPTSLYFFRWHVFVNNTQTPYLFIIREYK